jgi:electron transfer flavoprotein beta subunit
MNIAVCVKPIPDPSGIGSFESDNTLVRPEKLVIDDADRYGVELALRLRDAAGDGSVTAYAMAPLGDGGAIRTALAMGADVAVQVVDDSLSGSDSLVTAKVLSTAIKRQSFDLIIAGTESTDGYSGVMPVQIATLLDVPAVTFATEVTTNGESLEAWRQTDRGREKVNCPLPALITVTAGIVDPRYPSFKGIMSAKTKPFTQIPVSDLGITDPVGWAGTRQEIISIEDAPSRGGGQKIIDEGDAYQNVIRYLEEAKVL